MKTINPPPMLRVMTKDIRGAKRNDWNECPIARAARRVNPLLHVQVFDEHILVDGHQCAHTDETWSFATSWDVGDRLCATSLQISPDFREKLYVQNNP